MKRSVEKKKVKSERAKKAEEKDFAEEGDDEAEAKNRKRKSRKERKRKRKDQNTRQRKRAKRRKGEGGEDADGEAQDSGAEDERVDTDDNSSIEVIEDERGIRVRTKLGTKEDRDNLNLLLQLKWLDSKTIKLMRQLRHKLQIENLMPLICHDFIYAKKGCRNVKCKQYHPDPKKFEWLEK